MLPLDEKYWEKIEAIAGEIQNSEQLQQYLEEEEEEFYLQLKELYEPQIAEVYEEVAANDPLQLVAFEKALLHEAFEGMYLPKVLGYTVLRGQVDKKNYKYTRPQEHFKEVLLAICNSANFDILRKRIGQSIQMGFCLSSDIWVTNLVEDIPNKRIRHFLNSQRVERLYRLEERERSYERYWKQFKNDNFQSAEFPATKSEFQVFFPALKNFLLFRVKRKLDNQSIVGHLRELVSNEAFFGMKEHLQVASIYAHFFDVDAEGKKELTSIFSKLRAMDEEFVDKWFEFVLQLHRSELDISREADSRISQLLDKSVKDDMGEYYSLMDNFHSKGFMHEDAQEAVKVFYNKHEGLSTINECLRQTIFQYFARVLNNIDEEDYHELFELAKYYGIYMHIFGNQQFNQNLEDLSMNYVEKLLKKYTDKRGKDYQDIKKFVSTTFLDLGFLKEKEVVELFKTRRKRKKSEDED